MSYKPTIDPADAVILVEKNFLSHWPHYYYTSGEGNWMWRKRGDGCPFYHDDIHTTNRPGHSDYIIVVTKP